MLARTIFEHDPPRPTSKSRTALAVGPSNHVIAVAIAASCPRLYIYRSYIVAGLTS